MGKPVASLPEDNVASHRDLIVITDELTGKTKNLAVEKLMDFIQAASTSIVTTNNIKQITETDVDNWLDELNALQISWVIGTGDVPFVERYNQASEYVGTYLYRKSSTETIRIGQGETQVTLGDFTVIQDDSDVGETNTMSSFGAGVDLLKEKSGVDFVMQSLKAGVRDTISVTVEPDGIHIDTKDGLGEVNTLTNLGSASLVGAKTGSAMGVRGISASYANASVSGDNVVITAWGKIVRTSSFTLSATDSQRTIHIDNGTTPVVITIPDTLATSFEAGVQQIGTGEVSFVTSGSASLEYSENKLKGQGAICMVETLGNDSDRMLITGMTKA